MELDLQPGETMRRSFWQLTLLFTVALQVFEASALRATVIYGDDDRLDYYQVQDLQVKASADATVMLVRSTLLTEQSNGRTLIQTSSYGQDLGLCPIEPYYEQEKAGYCSGFLVAPDTIVTAGHCIRSQSDCDNVRFVFDFKFTSAKDQPRDVSTNLVFRCAKIVHTVAEPVGEDFAVIRLDRPVTHVAPLSFRSSGTPVTGDSLTVIGYSWGLPLKVSGGAQVRKIEATYLQANLDTYAGNSGSAVLNAATGLVEGVLVRGEADYDLAGGCRVSRRCTDTGCRGEDVTLFERVRPYLSP